MYYVKAVNEEKVLLANSLEEKVVSEKDLRNVKDTIVGFNRITGKLSVKTIEDLQGYYISKRKLVENEINIEGEYLYENYKFELISENPLTVKVTISFFGEENENLCIYPTIKIGHDNICYAISDTFGIDTGEVHIHLVYDIKGYMELRANNLSSSFLVEKFSKVVIESIELTPRSDLSHFKCIEKLFNYNGTWQVEMKADLDLSNYTIDRRTELIDVFGNILPLNIKPPKFISDYEVTENDFIDIFKTQNMVDFRNAVNLMSAYIPDLENLRKEPLNVPLLQTFSYGSYLVSDILDLPLFTYKIMLDKLILDKGYEEYRLIDNVEISFITDHTKHLVVHDKSVAFIKNLTLEEKYDMLEYLNSHILGYRGDDGELNTWNKVGKEFFDKYTGIMQRINAYNFMCFLTCKIIKHGTDMVVFFEEGLKDFDSLEINLIKAIFNTLPKLLKTEERVDYRCIFYVGEL